MTRFQLVVLDPTHMILATRELLRQDQAVAAREAFSHWKESGGALIIGDCEIVDRQAVSIDLDLDDPARTRADIPESPRGRALGALGESPGSPRDDGDDARGFLKSK